MAQIVTLGELLAEFMAGRVGQPFHEPGTFLGPYPSGAPAIFVDQAAKTGATAAMFGCVGQDGFGDLILNRLRSDAVDVSAIRRTDALPTGTAFITYQNGGGRSYIFNIGNSAAALIDEGLVDQSILEDCRYFHVMGSSLANDGVVKAVRRAVGIVKKSGGKISFDPNIRTELLASPTLRAALDYLLGVADILLPSEADLSHWCPQAGEDDAVARLFALGPAEMIVVKKASAGSTCYQRERSFSAPAFKVDEVDPTGAGDCFGGTFVSCLAQGIPPEKCLLLANAAGALAVSVRGPMEGNSTLAQIECFIARAERRA